MAIGIFRTKGNPNTVALNTGANRKVISEQLYRDKKYKPDFGKLPWEGEYMAAQSPDRKQATETFDEKPYKVTSFAEKHGLNMRTAELLLLANGASRAKCDAAAMAFLSAVAVYAKRQSAR